MRSRLSYYSVVLLVGLAIVSALVFAMNPFNGAPASASPAARSVASSSAASASSSPASNSPGISTPAGNGIVNSTQPGGSFDGVHHHHDSDGFPGAEGAAGNGTTSTTSTGTVYSVDE
jgi:hypothetical protein